MTMLLASAKGNSPDCRMYPSPIFSLPYDHDDQCHKVINVQFNLCTSMKMNMQVTLIGSISTTMYMQIKHLTFIHLL